MFLFSNKLSYPEKLVDCTWAPWTECKENTKNKKFFRTRKIKEEAKFGGKECGGKSKQECGK